ncbi:MAG TPA: DAK2 domain-containing protein [Solirubrobacteraceae bacterium]|nr:DAK2 domain-containing protein [Solirubrobacteraceae bacterium]
MAYDTNLSRFRAVVAAALAHLEAHRQEVNDLNVFPVADGDTGDNMALTLRAVLAELDRLVAEQEQQERTLDELGREQIVEAVARAALLGARGNSGVILSQFIRGAAEELASRPGELVDPALVGSAMARSVDRAYASVRNPAEGTILTVARAMAHQVATELAHADSARLEPGSADDVQDATLASVLESALDAGQEAVRKTPEQLQALKEAGVVDSGGYALTIIFAGVIAALRGSEAPEIEHHSAPARITHPEHSSETYRYCTNFAVTGDGLDLNRWRDELEQLGDSLLVVGDEHTLKVHVHTDDPEAATGLFAGVGEVSHLDVADMHAQVVQRAERLSSNGDGAMAAGKLARCGVVAVTNGDGMRMLFESEGATVVDGGPTLNPSTYEILAAIHEIPAEEVVVLPNSSNVIMAAERAAELSEKAVRVVPSKSQQAGLSAMIAYESGSSADDVAGGMEEAILELRIGSVAPAAREDVHGRFRVGDAVGFVDGEIVAWGDPQETLSAVLRSLARDAELITCISGEGAPVPDAVAEGLLPDGVELELKYGGQPAYWWLLAAE